MTSYDVTIKLSDFEISKSNYSISRRFSHFEFSPQSFIFDVLSNDNERKNFGNFLGKSNFNFKIHHSKNSFSIFAWVNDAWITL